MASYAQFTCLGYLGFSLQWLVRTIVQLYFIELIGLTSELVIKSCWCLYCTVVGTCKWLPEFDINFRLQKCLEQIQMQTLVCETWWSIVVSFTPMNVHVFKLFEDSSNFSILKLFENDSRFLCPEHLWSRRLQRSAMLGADGHPRVILIIGTVL